MYTYNIDIQYTIQWQDVIPAGTLQGRAVTGASAPKRLELMQPWDAPYYCTCPFKGQCCQHGVKVKERLKVKVGVKVMEPGKL